MEDLVHKIVEDRKALDKMEADRTFQGVIGDVGSIIHVDNTEALYVTFCIFSPTREIKRLIQQNKNRDLAITLKEI